MPSTFLSRRAVHRAGFSLTELLVAVGVFAVGGAVAFPFLSGDMGLYARNFSINKSNNSLRYSLQSLKRDIDMSIEPPMLVSATITNNRAAIAPLVQTTPQGAQAILAYVNYGPAYQLKSTSTDSSGNPVGTPINPKQPITINRNVFNTANDPYAVTSPLPQVGDRILFMSPGPYTKGMSEYVDLTTGKPVTAATVNTVVKPGRLITAVSPSSDPTSGTPSSSFTVTIDQTNALPTDASGNCTIYNNNSVYFFRESLYIASTLNDSNNQPVERQLLFYRSVNTPTNPIVLIRDLDPTPQETDQAFAATPVVAPFTYYTRSGGNYPLALNLPIRALDYARAIGDRNLAGQSTDTSAAEFNVYLRSSTLLNIKGRLDDTSLSSIKAN